MKIEISELTKRYGHISALNGLTLSIHSGEKFGLIGPDGAGKTSLMRVLCGLIKPDAGGYRIGDLDGNKDIRQIKTLIGYMPQRFSLYPDLTVEENLRFFADLFGVFGDELSKRKERLLKFSRLDPYANRRAAALSGGMKQKLALSCALIHTPSVLILDEPTTGVDPLSRREFWAILSELSLSDKVTILVSTPYMDEASKCDRIAFLQGGRILASGEPGEMMRLYPFSVMVLKSNQLNTHLKKVQKIPEVKMARILGDKIRISVENVSVSNMEKRLRETGLSNFTLSEDSPTIEDAFVSLAGGADGVDRLND